MCVLLTHLTCECDCEASSSLYMGRSRGLVTICHQRGGKSPCFRAGGKASVRGPPTGVSSCSCFTWKRGKEGTIRKGVEMTVRPLCCGAVSALFLLCHMTLWSSLQKRVVYTELHYFYAHILTQIQKLFSFTVFPFLKQQGWEQTLLPHLLLIKRNSDNYYSKFPLLWPLHLTTPPRSPVSAKWSPKALLRNLYLNALGINLKALQIAIRYKRPQFCPLLPSYPLFQQTSETTAVLTEEETQGTHFPEPWFFEPPYRKPILGCGKPGPQYMCCLIMSMGLIKEEGLGGEVTKAVNCRMNLLLSMNTHASSCQMLTYFLENTALLDHKIMTSSNPISQ